MSFHHVSIIQSFGSEYFSSFFVWSGTKKMAPQMLQSGVQTFLVIDWQLMPSIGLLATWPTTSKKLKQHRPHPYKMRNIISLFVSHLTPTPQILEICGEWVSQTLPNLQRCDTAILLRCRHHWVEGVCLPARQIWIIYLERLCYLQKRSRVSPHIHPTVLICWIQSGIWIAAIVLHQSQAKRSVHLRSLERRRESINPTKVRSLHHPNLQFQLNAGQAWIRLCKM